MQFHGLFPAVPPRLTALLTLCGLHAESYQRASVLGSSMWRGPPPDSLPSIRRENLTGRCATACHEKSPSSPREPTSGEPEPVMDEKREKHCFRALTIQSPGCFVNDSEFERPIISAKGNAG
ncbi:uncharacterized protein EI97DRAFT_61649 [Westerdykella ornata]|uniref:Uncharacterized protein n=1 Tax=Westerdykella ornata TaxID=318751 RepID=A0A6A6JJ20_WESOR|nr:uncharacterized protein EI97DRAFT_61649 [Westerdykella ornata]KAF2275958.1 hypothetical protein EI97DRAFT_61649 [Westerdykella ornata]